MASRKYEALYVSDSFFIPAAITDIFLGTLIWLESPQSLEGISRLQLLADVQSLLEPRESLLRHFVQAAQDLADRGQISTDEFLLLRTSQVARSLLQELTLGDPENFSHRTPEEILHQIKDAVREEERAAAAEREEALRDQYLAEKADRLTAVAEKAAADARVRTVCDRIALAVAFLFFILLSAVWVGIFVWVSEATGAVGWRQTVGLVLTLVLSAGTLIVPVKDVLSISSTLRGTISMLLLRHVFRHGV